LVEIGLALEDATDIREIKGLHGRVIVLRTRIRTSGLGLELLNQARKLQLVAERKMGHILPHLVLRGGDRKSADQEDRCRLEDWGISRTQSHQWQMEAGLSEEGFDGYLSGASRGGKAATSNGLFHLAKTQADAEELAVDRADPLGRVAGGLQDLARQGKRFPSICIESPWAPGGNGRANGFRLDPRLAQLPVMQAAGPQVHLYLKVVAASQDGVKVLKEWGLSVKVRLFRLEASLDHCGSLCALHEVWLLGVRDGSGRAIHGLPHSLEGAGVFAFDPALDMRQIIERLSPPPYLDLFASRPFSKDWTTALPQRR
jgi:hypothetical protein